MQENRSIAPGLGAFRLTLQSRENGFCGYVYSAALGCRAEFTSLARLIVLLEEWMNTATDSPVPEKPSAAAAPADVELEVRLRQHYSWQGQLRDLKGGAVFSFHSVLELLLQLAPQTKTIGTIYSSSEVNSQLQVDVLKKLAVAKGINVIEATVSTVNDIQQAAHSLIGKVDAVYVPTDNVMASSMPTLVAVTDEAKLPVICGESDPVRAGGLATLGIDYYKLGEQTGVMAAEILSGKGKPQTMPIQTQKEFKIVVNETTAKRNGITIPQDILAKAEVVK